MTGEKDWDAHERAAREGLEALAYVLGEWEGEGTAHGQPMRGRLVASLALGGTFIEVRETLEQEDGVVDYEDIALYRLDVDEQVLKVTHFQAPAWVMEREVSPLEGGGHRWTAGPFAPRVELRPAGEGLRIEVHRPFAGEPEVVMGYRKV